MLCTTVFNSISKHTESRLYRYVTGEKLKYALGAWNNLEQRRASEEHFLQVVLRYVYLLFDVCNFILTLQVVLASY